MSYQTTAQLQGIPIGLTHDQLAREIAQAAERIREAGPVDTIVIYRSGAMRPREVVIMAGDVAYEALNRLFPKKQA